MSNKIAIIDLGSNSIRLVIFNVFENNYYKLVEQEKEMVRLGENMSEDNLLKTEPMERTLLTLKLFKSLIKSHKVSKIICTATAAVRNSDNGKNFIDRIKKETNFEFKIISGNQEAYHGYLGVINTISEDSFFLIDIGGASTEISEIVDKEIANSVSLKIGAVSLSTLYDIDNSQEKEALKEYISKIIAEHPWIANTNSKPLIGLGGTIRSFAKIVKRYKAYPIDKIHNYCFETDFALKKIDLICNKTYESRMKINGLDDNRVDIIVPGLMILKEIIKKLYPSEIIISGNGLREGLFFSHLLKDKKTPLIKNIQKSSVMNAVNNYDLNYKHSKHIKYFATKLFKKTELLHGLDSNYLRLLKYGAYLHDIGIFVDYYSHHKHAFYLILNSNLYGFNHRELLILAYICARHRNKNFKIDQKKYQQLLNKDDIRTIKILSLFLRIAENLDRNEEENICKLDTKITPDEFIVHLHSKKDVDLEISAAQKSSEDFYKLFGKRLIFEKKEIS